MTRVAEWAEKALDVLQGQQWLDRPADKIGHLAASVSSMLGDLRQPVGNVLHGTSLGHPLHPMLTDIPVGAWTTAAVLDTIDVCAPGSLGRSGGGRAAQASIGLGLVGGAAAAVAGLADWQHTQDNARRIGLLHGATNVVVLGCYATSWIQRRHRRNQAGRRTSALGYGLLLVSGYLGGSLVFDHRVGVDHADRRPQPRQFVPVLRDDELREGQPVSVEAEGVSIVLVRHEGIVRALGEQCSHLGGPLSEGSLRGGTIVCPWHGSAFDVRSGTVRAGPATCAQPIFETRVVNGQIEVRFDPKPLEAPPASVGANEQGRTDAGY